MAGTDVGVFERERVISGSLNSTISGDPKCPFGCIEGRSQKTVVTAHYLS